MCPSILGKLEPFVTVLRIVGFVKLKFTMTRLTLRLMTGYDLQLDTVGYLQGFPGTITIHYIALFVGYFPRMTVVRVT